MKHLKKMQNPRIQQLAKLLEETGHAHHKSFISTDGADPEWALWYASHLQIPLSELLNREFTQSLIVYELVRLDRTAESGAPWPEVYAMELLTKYS